MRVEDAYNLCQRILITSIGVLGGLGEGGGCEVDLFNHGGQIVRDLSKTVCAAFGGAVAVMQMLAVER